MPDERSRMRELYFEQQTPGDLDEISRDMHCLIELNTEMAASRWRFSVCCFCVDFTSTPGLDGWWIGPDAEREYCDDCRRFLFVKLGLWEGAEHAG